MRILLFVLIFITIIKANKFDDAFKLFLKNPQDSNTVQKAYFMIKGQNTQSLKEKTMFYIIGGSYYIQSNQKEVLKKLQKIYKDIKSPDLPPISYLKFEALLEKNNTIQKVKLLKEAIKDNSAFFPSYFALASLYMDLKKYDLAIDILKRALKYSIFTTKEKAKIYAFLAFAYREKRSFLDTKLDCIMQNNDLLKLSIQKAKEALKLNPKMYELYILLADDYNALGKDELALSMLQRAKPFIKNDKNYKSYFEHILINCGALESYLKMVKEKKDSNSTSTRAYAYFYAQKWKKALKYQKEIIAKKNYFYSYLRYVVINLQLNNKQKAKEILQNIPPKSIDNDWKKALRANYLNKISDEALLKKADTVCKKSEANFYIGMKYYPKEKEKAYTYFKKVLNLKVYGYTEYIASKYFLAKSDKKKKNN